MADQSILGWLGLPANFGYALLIIGLVLTLAPYLGGSDFGVVKIPNFEPPARRALRVIGPVVFLGAVTVHVQFISEGSRVGVIQNEPTSLLDRLPCIVWFGNRCERLKRDTPPMAEPQADPEPPTRNRLPVGLSPGSWVIAPRTGGQCLYPATVINVSGDLMNIRFAFGRDGEVQKSQALPLPNEPVSNVTPGEAVFAHLSAADAWAPGIVKEVRGARAYVELEPDTDCAAQYGRPFVWADITEASLISRED